MDYPLSTSLVAGVAAMVAAACSSPADSASLPLENQFVGHNAYGIITGEQFPIRTDPQPVSSLRKEITINVSGDPAFTLGKGYVLRYCATDCLTSPATKLVVPITNNSDRAVCFVDIDSIFRDADGGQLLDTFSNATASVGEFAEGLWVDSCFAAGESGYATSVTTEPIFESVESVDMDITAQWERDCVEPGPRLIPQSYELNADGDLVITAKNEGTRPIAVHSYTTPTYIMLDDQDRPLFYNNVLLPPDEPNPEILQPGETMQSVDKMVAYKGTGGSKLYVMNKFEPAQ